MASNRMRAAAQPSMWLPLGGECWHGSAASPAHDQRFSLAPTTSRGIGPAQKSSHDRLLRAAHHMSALELRTLARETDIPAARGILREYAASLSFDLCFQDFDAELANLPGQYAEPRGALLLAFMAGQLVGCCAFRPLDHVDTPNACEMKRLYVRPAYRRSGAGRVLAEAVMARAQQAGYSYLLLDTLSGMEAARALYTDLGFEEIAPYYHNPIQGSHYLRVKL